MYTSPETSTFHDFSGRFTRINNNKFKKEKTEKGFQGIKSFCQISDICKDINREILFKFIEVRGLQRVTGRKSMKKKLHLFL